MQLEQRCEKGSQPQKKRARVRSVHVRASMCVCGSLLLTAKV